MHIFQRGSSHDESFEAGNKRAKAFERCFTYGHEHTGFDIHSKLDASGYVVKARITRSETALTEPERECILDASYALRYRCPDEPGDKVWARFSVWSSD